MSSRESIAKSLAVHHSWANTRDRSARTAPARQARWQRYLERARAIQGPDAGDQQVEQAAEHLRQADMLAMSLEAIKARQAKAKARKQAS